MNLVGKIFTVLIFLMCVVFATFALMVQSAHKNWRAAVEDKGGLADQLTEAGKRNQELIKDRDAAKAKLEEEKTSIRRRLTALSDAAKNAIDERDKSEIKYQEVAAQVRAMTGAIKEISAHLNVLQTVIDGLRGEIKVAVDQRNLTQKELLDKNDRLLTAVAERERLEKLQRELATQINKMRSILTHFKLNEQSVAASPPEGLEGEVTGVVQNAVEISVGADSGVRKGFIFVVTRPSTGKYIGKIEVTRVDYPNRAVCYPVKGSLNDQVQRGDHVKAETKPR
jgi:small-conductance mechanosensitive channel